MDRRYQFAGVVILAMIAVVGCGPSADAVAPDGNRAVTTATPLPPEPSAALDLAEDTATPGPDQPTIPDRTVEESGGFKLATLSSASCTAEGPPAWTISAPDRSDRADVMSPDGSMYAGYGIQAVNTSLQGFAAAYQPPLNDPDLYSEDTATVAAAYGRIIVAAVGGSADLVVEEVFQPNPDYLLLSVAGSTHRGAIFFRASGYPGDGFNYSYALPMYFAFTTLDRWDTQGLLTARVAASIRCRTQFQPPNDYFTVDAADTAASIDANDDEAGYNPQLGTEPVNDPTTGENYLVDPSVNWSETGPDGPGYYVQKSGGDYQKLEPGRID
jgi:hypothetical protein